MKSAAASATPLRSARAIMRSHLRTAKAGRNRASQRTLPQVTFQRRSPSGLVVTQRAVERSSRASTSLRTSAAAIAPRAPRYSPPPVVGFTCPAASPTESTRDAQVRRDTDTGPGRCTIAFGSCTSRSVC